jgi:hypothetical protein
MISNVTATVKTTVFTVGTKGTMAIAIGILAGIGLAAQKSSVEPTNALRYEERDAPPSRHAVAAREITRMG